MVRTTQGAAESLDVTIVHDDLDHEILRRIARGDVDAVGSLYDRHAARLLRVAARVVRSRLDAEDVVHDVFVAVHEYAKTYRPDRGTVLAWLLTITKNRAIDLVRKQVRQHRLLADNPSSVEPSGHDPEAATRAAMTGKVTRLLGKMRVPQRELLRLVYVDGLSLPQIAERKGMCLGTVKSRTSRAMKQLRVGIAACDR